MPGTVVRSIKNERRRSAARSAGDETEAVMGGLVRLRHRLVSTDGQRRRRTDDMRRGEGDYEIKKAPFLPFFASGDYHHKTLEAVISDRPALKAPNLSAHIIGPERDLQGWTRRLYINDWKISQPQLNLELGRVNHLGNAQWTIWTVLVG